MSCAFFINLHIINRYSCYRKNLGVYFHIYRSRITEVAYIGIGHATFLSPTFEFKYYSLWRKHCHFPFRLFNRYERVRQQSLFDECNMCRSSEQIQMQLCGGIYRIKLRNEYAIEYFFTFIRQHRIINCWLLDGNRNLQIKCIHFSFDENNWNCSTAIFRLHW